MSDLPAPDEVEISLFGPGYGECILLHIGDGNWIVVDSCVHPITKQPIPLSYFDRIGVDVSSAVQLVIATHWHDDHVRGLGRVFEACKNADFVCSESFHTKEFFIIANFYGHGIMTETSGIDELSDVLRELLVRAKLPIFVVANRCIWRSRISAVGRDFSIHALSPSDAALIASKLDFVELVPRGRMVPKRRILPFSKNRASVVLWVEIGNHNILLGADMEKYGDPRDGWSAIVSSVAKPPGKASVFKIPHHGAPNGHHPEVWNQMLIKSPIAVLTPFYMGKNNRPDKSDIDRICSLTDNAFATSNPARIGRIPRVKAVERTMKEMAISIRPVNPSIGHVRLRAKQNEKWSINLYDDATRLCGQTVA